MKITAAVVSGRGQPRLVTRYDLADINCAAADATSGATIKPMLTLPH